jgi:hypothetical protein
MNVHKNSLLGTVSRFITSNFCSIEDAGNGDAGGGSSGGGQSDGNASPTPTPTSEESMEKEFYDPNSEDDDGESSDGEGGGKEPASGEEGEGGDADGEGEEGSDGEGEDGKEPAGKKEGEGETPPKKNRAQERIDELTATSRNHERESEKWRNEALKLGYTPDGEAPSLPEEPDPEKYPYGEHDPEYLKDRGKYDAKVEMVQEQTQARFKAEAASLDAKWTKNQAGALDRYPDFDEVVAKTQWACPAVIAIGIKDSDVGPDIAYALAKDPAEADRIAKLSPLEQAREFGRKESEFTSSKRITELEAEIAKLKGPDDAGKPKPKIITKAPEPPKRRVSGGGARHETPGDTDDFAAFEKKADTILAKQKY